MQSLSLRQFLNCFTDLENKPVVVAAVKPLHLCRIPFVDDHNGALDKPPEPAGYVVVSSPVVMPENHVAIQVCGCADKCADRFIAQLDGSGTPGLCVD